MSKKHKEILYGKPLLLENSNTQPQLPDNLIKYSQFTKDYEQFHIMGHDESHFIRRKQILKAHPEVKILFGHDKTTIWVAIACNIILFNCAYQFKDLDWWLFLITAYVIGGTFTHTCLILVHELTHFTCFEDINLNKALAIFANLPTTVPSAITFGKYHVDHHTYMNIENFDPDLPSRLEQKLLTNTGAKFIFILFQALFYAIRPLILKPKKPSVWELINLISIVFSNLIVFKFLGAKALLWLFCGTFMGMGLHPAAGHIIAEHYEFVNKLETYDYIGVMNFFNLNLGYHTEHHDFPMIPWTRLPLVRRMCPEFYEIFPSHKSYTRVIYNYIFSKFIGPWSRISRKQEKKD